MGKCWGNEKETLFWMYLGFWSVHSNAYSGAAYTAAKEGMDFEWCKKCDEGLPKPDIVYFMDTSSVSMIRARSGLGAERYEEINFNAFWNK